jgi:hypothetical protein
MFSLNSVVYSYDYFKKEVIIIKEVFLSKEAGGGGSNIFRNNSGNDMVLEMRVTRRIAVYLSMSKSGCNIRAEMGKRAFGKRINRGSLRQSKKFSQ